jgi:hypothetical protein
VAVLPETRAPRRADRSGGVGTRIARVLAVPAALVCAAGIAASIVLVALAPGAPGEFRPPRTLVFYVSIVALAVPGALIMTRRPEHPLGWILTFAGLGACFVNGAAGYAMYALYGPGAPGGLLAAWLFTWTTPLYLGPLMLLFLLFPDGRLPSARWRPVVPLTILGTVGFAASMAVLPANLALLPFRNPFGLYDTGDLVPTALAASIALLLGASIASVASVVWRLRDARGIERQQLKWLAFGGSVAALTCTLIVVLGLPLALLTVLLTVGITAIPIAVGVAILRYRLYDIDILVNRTLVYGALSAALAGAYFGRSSCWGLCCARSPRSPSWPWRVRRSPSSSCSRRCALASSGSWTSAFTDRATTRPVPSTAWPAACGARWTSTRSRSICWRLLTTRSTRRMCRYGCVNGNVRGPGDDRAGPSRPRRRTRVREGDTARAKRYNARAASAAGGMT